MGPFQRQLEQGPLVLDGGLATELERAGHELLDPLWSARLLLDEPEAIARVHAAFAAAGADVVTTASYQLSAKGLAERRGSSSTPEREVAELFAASVELARRAAPSARVAGSLGGWGACLHDGSEYRGDYDPPPGGFVAFHRPRVRALVEAGADVLAFETLPTLREAEAFVRLLDEHPGSEAWLSVTLRDADHTAAGESLQGLAELARAPGVAAVGVNCGAPSLLLAAIEGLAARGGGPFVAYPNRGERYVAGEGWEAGSGEDPLAFTERLLDAGVRLIGGCCRTTPADIAALRARVDAWTARRSGPGPTGSSSR